MAATLGKVVTVLSPLDGRNGRTLGIVTLRSDTGIPPDHTGSRRTATVIGAGPGGLMAAEVLAAAGVQVTVFEHMASAGRKLQLAGRGGLNITHSEPLAAVVERYGPAAARLETALRTFGPTQLRAWCDGLGEPTFIGTSGRVFPSSFRATSLLRAWLARLAELDVTIRTRHRWIGWEIDDEHSVDPRRSIIEPTTRGSDIDTDPGERLTIASDVTVFALGGASWPRVGSDGGWVTPFRLAGVDVRDLRSANCGLLVAWSDHLIERHQGAPVKNVAVSVTDPNTGATRSVRGDVTITRTGLEGGAIYAHSAMLRAAFDRSGSCSITIDLHPDRTHADLVALMARRRAKDSLSTFLHRSLGLLAPAIALLRDAHGGPLPSESAALATLIKAVPVTAHALAALDRAISSAGGVALDEIDESFMVRRLPGTFLVGEMLDWEAPTGGYLLQATFSTAVAAATGALDWLAATAAHTPQGASR